MISENYCPDRKNPKKSDIFFDNSASPPEKYIKDEFLGKGGFARVFKC